MSTDDVTTIASPCLCGAGTIEVTQTMPDHPWVRESQIYYSAALKCTKCSEIFAVENEYGNRHPRIVKRVELEQKARARAGADAARALLDAAPQVDAIRKELVARIDAEPSKAAKLRLLQSLRLAHNSYATFIKGNVSGSALLRWTSGSSLIEAALRLKLPIAEELAKKVEELDALQHTALAMRVTTVRTGARWMAT